MSKKTDLIRQAVQPAIEGLGFELVDVEIKREGPSQTLYVYIYKEGGVFIADCERVSQEIDPIIEELDPISDAYCLCVSSPGADRPLKTPADFRRAMDTEVEASLYRAVEGTKHVIGTLAAYDEEAGTVTLMLEEGGTLLLQQKDIARIRPYIRF